MRLLFMKQAGIWFVVCCEECIRSPKAALRPLATFAMPVFQRAALVQFLATNLIKHLKKHY
uniref:Uncharacterized protein n=1 Tax=Anguilla anguilla TaxID=7936 RepID=A0A0E9UPC0_ANGAN